MLKPKVFHFNKKEAHFNPVKIHRISNHHFVKANRSAFVTVPPYVRLTHNKHVCAELPRLARAVPTPANQITASFQQPVTDNISARSDTLKVTNARTTDNRRFNSRKCRPFFGVSRCAIGFRRSGKCDTSQCRTNVRQRVAEQHRKSISPSPGTTCRPYIYRRHATARPYSVA